MSLFPHPYWVATQVILHSNTTLQSKHFPYRQVLNANIWGADIHAIAEEGISIRKYSQFIQVLNVFWGEFFLLLSERWGFFCGPGKPIETHNRIQDYITNLTWHDLTDWATRNKFLFVDAKYTYVPQTHMVSLVPTMILFHSLP